MVKKPVVKMVDVEKVYKLGGVQVHALRGVSMEALKGEFIVIMGPSGSGKTTILNLIGTLDKPSKGEVYIDGEDITILKERKLTEIRRNKIGFIFQFYNLIPVLTALENVELPMLIAGAPKKQREKRAHKLLKMVGLTDRVSHRPDELSGGEQQRVAIARALVNKPSIILADEPTGDLDTKSGIEVLKILRNLSIKEGAMVIAVTHDPIVSKLATRTLTIKDGLIVKEKRLPVKT
jgi:putative ABC transport system ATP-binding protein